ncbi:MAG: hypothetical protein AAGE96_25360 [Cyanobacteria bacterium P01_G01_bin.19]
MTLASQTQSEELAKNNQNSQETTEEKVLCPHCRRTATNGIKCKGMCVADDDY